MAVEISDHPEQSRYEARQGTELAGVAAYERGDGVITFTHTVVPDAFEGQGVGSALARTALDEARASGLAVVPQCSFIAGWIDRHREYGDLVRDA